MIVTIHPTISRIIRIDIDKPKEATRLADFIDDNSENLEVTQVVIYNKEKQAYILVFPKNEETEAVAELELIINEFKKK
jgi:hypothetical protein